MEKEWRLLPRTLPSAISLDPLNAEKMLMISSGALVPKATTVRPITNAEIFNFAAIDALPRTKISPPTSKIPSPARTRSDGISIYMYYEWGEYSGFLRLGQRIICF